MWTSKSRVGFDQKIKSGLGLQFVGFCTFASKMFNADNALVLSLVSQHSASDDVTNGVDGWAGGLNIQHKHMTKNYKITLKLSSTGTWPLSLTSIPQVSRPRVSV